MRGYVKAGSNRPCYVGVHATKTPFRRQPQHAKLDDTAYVGTSFNRTAACLGAFGGLGSAHHVPSY